MQRWFRRNSWIFGGFEKLTWQYPQEELVEHLREMETTGLNQIMNLPSFDPRFEVLERVAKDIIPYV